MKFVRMNPLMYTVDEVKVIMDAGAEIARPEMRLSTMLTDSRRLTDTDHGLFFALKGRRDGHLFLNEVYQSGVRNLVISDLQINKSAYPEANFFIVDDTLLALQKLAAHHRKQFNYQVIGLTGSNGKTIVKEWLYQLLFPDYNMIRSPKSYNSQMGVPLSVWQMNEHHTLAIIEAGISETGEMEKLEAVIRPTIGVLTSIGEAHNQGFVSEEKKIGEKLLLFKNVDLFIYPLHALDNYRGIIPGKQQLSWGENGKAGLQLIEHHIHDTTSRKVKAQYNDEQISVIIPFTDYASLQNSMTCLAVLLAMGYPPSDAAGRIQQLAPVKMRLELKSGINNCSVIDDSYSLDLSSLTIALDFLKQQNQHQDRTLILSDIPQSGIEPARLYQRVAQLITDAPVNRLIGVGENISHFSDEFSVQKQFFKTTEDLLEQFSALNFYNETILLKGARIFEFEKISKALTQKVHDTVLEINLNAVEHNLNYYKTQLKPGVKLMVMVKAFSYGSGSFEIASLLQYNKVDYLAVAYADEGVLLRKAGIKLPVMVMNPGLSAFDTIIAHNLEPEIYSFRTLNSFIELLKFKQLQHYPIHLKIDTGMHRLGFIETDIEALSKILSQSLQITVQSIFSHLAAAGNSAEDDFTAQQIHQFDRLSQTIKQQCNKQVFRHIANTSAIRRWPYAQFDMVRLGIGLYGIDPSSSKKNSPLQTVTSLKTNISQIKIIKPGETVGYDRQGKLPDGGTIATVKIGYADGYSRALGNGNGKMMVNGNEAATIGTICMDMCMLNVTGMAAQEGDEVIVFDSRIRVEDIARSINTIPYEVLTGISQRVKRVYYYE